MAPTSAYDPDPLDPQDFGFLIQIRKNMRIHGSRSKGKKINQKLKKKLFKGTVKEK